MGEIFDWSGFDFEKGGFMTFKQHMTVDNIGRLQFIIGSISHNGVSFSNNPMIQPNEAQARAECERLARANPGKTFVYYRVLGACVVPTPDVKWS